MNRIADVPNSALNNLLLTGGFLIREAWITLYNAEIRGYDVAPDLLADLKEISDKIAEIGYPVEVVEEMDSEAVYERIRTLAQDDKRINVQEKFWRRFARRMAYYLSYAHDELAVISEQPIAGDEPIDPRLLEGLATIYKKIDYLQPSASGIVGDGTEALNHKGRLYQQLHPEYNPNKPRKNKMDESKAPVALPVDPIADKLLLAGGFLAYESWDYLRRYGIGYDISDELKDALKAIADEIAAKGYPVIHDDDGPAYQGVWAQVDAINAAGGEWQFAQEESRIMARRIAYWLADAYEQLARVDKLNLLDIEPHIYPSIEALYNKLAHLLPTQSGQPDGSYQEHKRSYLFKKKHGRLPEQNIPKQK